MTSFVLGFPMTEAGTVALVRKNKPDWQKNELNGFGGRVEHDETYGGCMFREFYDYTDFAIPNWNHVLFLKLQRPYISIVVYAALVVPEILKRISEANDSIHIAHMGMEAEPEARGISIYSQPVYELERCGELVEHTKWMLDACYDYHHSPRDGMNND
jgi:hypothetical protein